MPSAITVVQADQIYIPRHALPPSLIARLIRLAVFQNPEFYAAQAMRRSTHDKPRVISCAELTSHHVALPRGCFDAVCGLLASIGIAVTIEDCRTTGAPIPFAFTGELRPNREGALAALLPHDTGVLAATTAFGKTVLAIRMMAERGLNTLILVHRRQLMDQWPTRGPCPQLSVSAARFGRHPHWRESGAIQISAGFLSIGHFSAHERKFSRHFKRIF